MVALVISSSPQQQKGHPEGPSCSLFLYMKLLNLFAPEPEGVVGMGGGWRLPAGMGEGNGGQENALQAEWGPSWGLNPKALGCRKDLVQRLLLWDHTACK